MVMQYEAYDVLEHELERPEWQINLRWFFALLAIFLVAMSLFLFSLWRASRADVALPLLQGALVTTFFPTGVQESQLEQWREQSREFSEVALLEGIELSYTPQDLRDDTGAALTPRAASLHVVAPLAEAIRRQGLARGLSLVSDEALKEQLSQASRQHLESAVQASLAAVFFDGALPEHQLERWQQRLDDAANQRVALLDGVDIRFTEESIAGLSASDASLALLEPLLSASHSQGIQAALDRVEDESLRARLRQRLGNDGKTALHQVWLEALFPQGISSAQRNAWRAQLSASPAITVQLAPAMVLELTREALTNEGLNAALKARLEPISLAYLTRGKDAVLELLSHEETRADFRAALPAARASLEAIFIEEFYPTGLQDSQRLQLWRTRLADAQQESVALIPSLPQRYVQADLAGLDAAAVEKRVLEPIVQRFLAQGALASVTLINDASLRPQVMDSYAPIENSLNEALALSLFGDIDDAARLAQWQQALDAPNQWVNGLPSQFTAFLSSDILAGLQPREAGLQLLKPLAEAIYASDIQQPLYDAALAQKLADTLQPLRFTVATQRGKVTLLFIAVTLLSALCCLACIMLSDGLSKLANLALILLGSSFLGTICWFILQQRSKALTAQPPQLSELNIWHYFQHFSDYMLSFIPMHFVNFMSQLHLGIFCTGGILLLMSLSLGLGQRWQRPDL